MLSTLFNLSNLAYNYVDVASLINATNLTPYIATIDESTTNLDYTKLGAAGVAGILLYGGSYYTVMHTVREHYRNTNLASQVGDADKYGMPYGLYVDVRARSSAEAKLECNQLWYLISKYSPKLGIWLRLQTASSKGVNNQILEEYYNHFEKWGIGDNCGLYISQNDLTTISWDKFYDRYLLWLVDHVDTMAGVDDTLLTPEFFMLSEVS